MNPEVAAAVAELRERGVLDPKAGARLARIARGELVSLRVELRLLLYLGVLATVAGVGLLVQRNLDRIGPVAIAAAIGLAAATSLAWVARASPPFSRAEVPSPSLAFDYVLLLGVLLAGSDLAYVEVSFTPLGAAWPWHLLIVALAAGALAVRYDSRVVFSVALSTFAAWRGVSASVLGGRLLLDSGGDVRLNAVACGVLFLAGGALLEKYAFKAHFEPVASYLAWLLILGSLLSGAVAGETRAVETGFAISLLACGGVLALFELSHARFGRFALGVIGAYAGLSRLVTLGIADETIVVSWFLVSSLLVLVALLLGHRKVRGRP